MANHFPSDTPLPIRPHLLILPQIVATRDQTFRYEPIGTIFMQITPVRKEAPEERIAIMKTHLSQIGYFKTKQ